VTSTTPVVWYTLDSADRDPRVFLDYLLSALTPLIGSIPLTNRLESPLTPDQLHDAYHELALVIANIPTPFVLVLDDYQVLEDSANLHGVSIIIDLLATVAHYAPQCTLVLSSRVVPTWRGLARLLAQQQAAVLDYQALQWDVVDAQHLAHLYHETPIDTHIIKRLVAKTEGWVTGLTVMLKHVRHMRHEHEPIHDDTERLFEYFAEQVIAPLPREVQDFLVETSVLIEVTPALADQLRERQDSQYLLDVVHRYGVFVLNRGGSLQYHALFRTFLRTRLARTPNRERDLLSRAGQMYRDTDAIEHALDCYLATGEHATARTVLLDRAPALQRAGRHTTLLTCFDRLHGLTSDPALHLAHARVYLDLGDWNRAEALLRLTESLSNPTHPSSLYWDTQLVLAQMYTAQADSLTTHTILDTITQATLPMRLHETYWLAVGRLAVLDGDNDRAITLFERMIGTPANPSQRHDPATLAYIHDHLAWAYGTKTMYAQAAYHLRYADTYWQTTGDHGRRTMTLNNLGSIAIIVGHYDEARQALELGLRLAQQTLRRRNEAHAHYSLGELSLCEGQLDLALTHFQTTHTLAEQLGMPLVGSDARIAILWVANFMREQSAIDYWNTCIKERSGDLNAENEARWQLAQWYHLTDSRAALDTHDLTCLHALSEQTFQRMPVERCALWFIRAAQAFVSGGWEHAEHAWIAFEQASSTLTDTARQHISRAHPPLIHVAAAQGRTLATQLLPHISVAPIRWEIYALGGFAYAENGQPCELGALHQAMLLRLLDAGPQGIVITQFSRDVWGGEMARAAINQALWRLRQKTGLSISIMNGRVAIWERSFWIQMKYDVHECERLLRAPLSADQVEQALHAYTGDFVVGSWIEAMAWADRRRLSIRTRLKDALIQTAQALESVDPRRSIQFYTYALQLDSTNEATAIRLMHLASTFGNTVLLESVFDQLTQSLRQIGSAPTPTTTAAYHRYQSLRATPN
jgi:ATP/maltotriose-dependent transcriptional regulator MalT